MPHALKLLMILIGLAVGSICWKVGDVWGEVSGDGATYAGTVQTPKPVSVGGKQWLSLETDWEAVKEVMKSEVVDDRGTVMVTAGNHGFREFMRNVEVTSTEAFPGKKTLVVMLDTLGLEWCLANTNRSTAICAGFNCTCPYATRGFSTEGYTSCLLGIYICKLRVKKAILSMGFSLLFIDGDAAIRPGVLQALPKEGGYDVVGACELCAGSCHMDKARHKIVDFGAKTPLKTENYYQINIGLVWLNRTEGLLRAINETIDLIVTHRLDFKSVDQTILNRRMLAQPLRTHCLPTSIGGLNVKSRSSRPKSFPGAWGVHAARLVSKTGFYKKAFLHHNNLWRLPLSEAFKADYERYLANPSGFKKRLQAAGEL
eukprot:TRINITY_DN46973_c0_g1_i1.p1 TRINITY_DN46973_c0_g1~~TRINITY_DN46973_c0_g1_i1.p1  ORF type:complete len:372 (+),score=55.09 TRINITY_DN46973_c0_g1_i1:83-1198(+)